MSVEGTRPEDEHPPHDDELGCLGTVGWLLFALLIVGGWFATLWVILPPVTTRLGSTAPVGWSVILVTGTLWIGIGFAGEWLVEWMRVRLRQ